jgi:hypothetical protein
MEQTTQLQSAKMISTCTVVGSLSCGGNSLILTPAFSNILPKAEVPGGVQFGFRFSVFGEREGPLGRARLLPSRNSVHTGTELVLGGPGWARGKGQLPPSAARSDAMESESPCLRADVRRCWLPRLRRG